MSKPIAGGFVGNLREVLSFHGQCIKRAFTGKFAKVEGWTGALSIIGLIIAVVFSPSEGEERLLLTVVPAVFFLGAFALTVFVGLLRAPVDLVREERARREEIEALRKPKFEISLPAGGTENISVGGNTSESLAGTRQTVVNSWMTDVLCFYCRNVGEVLIKNCRARVLSAKRENDGEETILDFVESIELTWKKEDTSVLSVDLPPDETRRIWLGGVRSRGHFWVYRDIKELPIEAQRVFGEPGKYRILIQIDADDVVPTQIMLEVIAEEGPKPEKAGFHRGRAHVSIVSQGSPRISSD